MNEHEQKLKELFGNDIEMDDIYYKKTEDGNMVVAQDEQGNDVVMKAKNIVSNDDPRLKKFRNGRKFGDKTMEEMLQLDMNIVKELTSKEHMEELKAKEDRRRLDKFKRQLEAEGIDPDSAVAKQRYKIYEQTKDFIRFPKELEAVFSDSEIDEYADELSIDDKNEIRKVKRNGLVMSPEMLLGSKRSNDLISMTSKTLNNDYYWLDFIRYCSTHQNIDITTIDGSREFIDSLWDGYMKYRRPPLFVLINKTIQELEDDMLDKLRADEKVDDKFVRRYRDDINTRIELVKTAKPYTMEDFRIFLFYFRQFGRHEEDKEYFDLNYPVSTGVKMKDYFDKFKDRTGFDFLDVYYHYYKLSEEIDFKKSGKPSDDKEVLGSSSLDEITINNKKEINNEPTLEDFMDGVDFDD